MATYDTDAGLRFFFAPIAPSVPFAARSGSSSGSAGWNSMSLFFSFPSVMTYGPTSTSFGGSAPAATASALVRFQK